MSQYNPYAAPAADHALAGGVPVQGEPQPWDVGDVIRSGWEIYKAHWAPLTFGCFVTTFIAALPGQVTPTLVLAGVVEESSQSYWAIHGPLSLVGWLVGEFFAAGFARAAMRVSRTNAVTFGDFFSGGSRFLPYVLMSFLRTFATAIGLVFFIVPGVIVALGFWNAPFYVVDQNLGPIASLKASWDSADGQKGNLFVLAMAELGITMLGMLACCFGLFVAVPVMLIARAIVYMRMSGTAPPPNVPPGAYAAVPPPAMGGYGQFGPPGTYGGGGGSGPPGYGGLP